ncbi:hypothetical protein L218DRAFT_1080983 [Marasmius fiardii PR-910]|nr:hypothetical protein L218DRAFT_1080983 [Marasmius fiardii PR-910]
MSEMQDCSSHHGSLSSSHMEKSTMTKQDICDEEASDGPYKGRMVSPNDYWDETLSQANDSNSLLSLFRKILEKAYVEIKVPLQPERTGTWQFMSAQLLRAKRGEHVPHLIVDELESFYHVLCWLVLKHGGVQKHQLHVLFDEEAWLREIFDEVIHTPDGVIGGKSKVRAFHTSRMRRARLQEPIRRLILVLGENFRVRYLDPPSDEILKKIEDLSSGKVPLQDEDITYNFFKATEWLISRAKLRHTWVLDQFKIAAESPRSKDRSTPPT